jgi:hypothetical protein
MRFFFIRSQTSDKTNIAADTADASGRGHAIW